MFTSYYLLLSLASKLPPDRTITTGEVCAAAEHITFTVLFIPRDRYHCHSSHIEETDSAPRCWQCSSTVYLIHRFLCGLHCLRAQHTLIQELFQASSKSGSLGTLTMAR